MTCQQLVEFLDDYHAGTVASAEREAFERHLGECTQCRRYLAGYRATIHLTKQTRVAPETLVEQMPDGLVQAILSARSRSDV